MVRTIRVLRVVGGLDPEFGGPTESAANACIASQRAGVLNTLAFPVAEHAKLGTAPVRRQLVEEGVEVQTFELFPPFARRSHRWGVSPQLVGWLRRNVEHHDLVHLHGAWGLSQMSGLIGAKRARRPCVMTPHETLTTFDVNRASGRLGPVVKKALKGLYLRRISLIVVASQLEARDSVSDGGVVRISVIPHPLRAALETPPASPHPSRRPLRIGFLGRLHPKKNVEVLIQAAGESSGTARLLIAGDGPPAYKRHLERLAARLGMAGRIEWLGFVEGDRRWSFLDSLDVLALPSEYECFGMVVAEAMARGIATVVSRNAGVAEIVERHGCGIVADPTADWFAHALRRLEREDGLLANLAAQAVFAARDELSMTAYGAAIRREYERLLEPSTGK